MKKFLTFFLLFFWTIDISAITVSPATSSPAEESYIAPDYPEGELFVRLKSLVDTHFSLQKKKNNSYAYYTTSKCISTGWLCTNYKYTSLTEKAIKLIVLDTYTGNEDFYQKLFQTNSYYGAYYDDVSSTTNSLKSITEILRAIPVGTSVVSDVWDIFGSSSSNSIYTFGMSTSDIGNDLLASSFGLDYSENSPSNDILSAIEQKIKEIKGRKCKTQNSTASYSTSPCPWNGEISNRYLPTEEELFAEAIYLNGRSVKIESLKDEFEYRVQGTDQGVSERAIAPYSDTNTVDSMNRLVRTELENTSLEGADSITNMRTLTLDKYEFFYLRPLANIRDNPSIDNVSTLKNLIQDQRNSNMIIFTETQTRFLDELMKELDYYSHEFQGVDNNITYILQYKKDSYTLEEAKAAIEKRESMSTSSVFGSNSWGSTLPCQSGGSYLVRSQCAAAKSNMNNVMASLGAYYADREEYPESIDAIDNSSYMPKGMGDFRKNFEYKKVGTDYEIRYIGHIGEGESASSEKKDYITLLSGATVPSIPAIFDHAPSESMVFYIKNPENLLDLLSIKSNTTTRLSGIDVSDAIKNTIQHFFELEDFSRIEKNLKHEVLLVVENLDLTAPDITMILSEADRDALAPSAQARVVGSKDGYIYVSNSKDLIDQYMSLPKSKSLSESADFRYVWTKKSSMIRDAYMFVGDAFFEKMLTFETYITHYRKYRDLSRLGKMQEYVWAYEDAYGQSPKSLSGALSKLDESGKLTPYLDQYELSESLVIDQNIGSLQSIKTLSEIDYDLSKITRREVEDYKMNVLKYRDIWRASLDPLGIVMNRYGDGMEVDFFMTPIPKMDASFTEIRSLFEGVSKDSLSFLTNPKIRMGLLSFVVGIDPKKLEQKILQSEDTAKGIQEINTELLGGKNIFDYLGGEGAFSLGNIPSDILDGWNTEKIDAYLTIEFTTQEKGMELIDIARKKFLDEMGDGSSGYFDMKSFLAKPLIEDYEGGKIYYVEAIPVPFVGKIGFAYTFIDNFFFIGLNRTTMKHIIDVAKTGDTKKKELIDNDTATKGTFFLTLFDGKTASNDLKGLYEKNRTSIPRYASLLDRESYGANSLSPLLSSYYATSIKSKRLGKEERPIKYNLGGFSVSEDEGNLRVRLDETSHASLSGATLQIWQNIITDERFPKDILSANGILAEDFLSNTMRADILALELIVQLDHAFAGSESLLRNSTLSLGLGDDEISFLTRVFREKESVRASGSVPVFGTRDWKTYLIWGLAFFGFSLLGVVGFLFIRKRNLLQSVTSVGNPNPTMISPIVPTSLVSPSSTTVPIIETTPAPTPMSTGSNPSPIVLHDEGVINPPQS